jgi:hypothetical protein
VLPSTRLDPLDGTWIGADTGRRSKDESEVGLIAGYAGQVELILRLQGKHAHERVPEPLAELGKLVREVRSGGIVRASVPIQKPLG